MNQRGVKRLLLGYFALFFGAVFLRIDYFPLSWVPMYGFREESQQITVPVGDLKRRDLASRRCAPTASSCSCRPAISTCRRRTFAASITSAPLARGRRNIAANGRG